MALSLISSRALKARLYYELKAGDSGSWVNTIGGTVIPSDQASEDYVGLGSVAPMREWQGSRVAQTMRAETYTLRNQKYENTLLVLGDERRRDKTAQVQMRITDLRKRYQQHWMRLATQAIMENGTGYDGSAFHADAHVSGASGSQDNNLTSNITTATAPTSEEAGAAIWDGIGVIQGFKDDSGEPINAGVTGFTILIPPTMEKGFRGALSAGTVTDGGAAAGVTNVLTVSGYTFNLVANPWLTMSLGSASAWTDKFAMFANDGRSMILQEEIPLLVTAKAEGSDFEHDTDNHEYGILTSRAVGYGAWQSSILHTFT